MPNNSTSPPPAYFLSLSLENVRSFGEEQTIYLTETGTENTQPAQWTIILGDNGVGKTTVLKVLAALAFREQLQPGSYGIAYYSQRKYDWNLRRREGKENTIIQAIAQGGRSLTGRGKTQTFLSSLEVISPSSKFTSATEHSEFEVPSVVNLICYGYGAGRTVGNSALGEPQNSTDTCASLFDDRADLLNAEEWFLQADYRIKSDDNPLIKQNFELLKKALIAILDEVTEIKVSPVAPGGNPQQGLQFLTPYGWVRLREMSLGYQTMVVWITDFASKLFIRYPKSKNPLAEPAIVLIDEIDLHLHPEWQRKVIGYLSGLFPNTQFIATAHSPLVVQAAGDAGANVVLLRRQNDQTVVVQNLEDVRGWRVDQILSSELFDETPARSPDTEARLTQRRQLLAKKKLTKADQEELARLNAKLPPLPFGDTPEAQQADAVVQALLQKLGKLPKPA